MGKSVTTKLYAAVLFGLFWFLATFSAWHQSEVNLALVIKQRQEDNGKFGVCQERFKIAEMSADSWKQLSDDKQVAINDIQRSINGNQTALNSCVTALAKTNPLANREVVVMSIPVATERIGNSIFSSPTYLSAIVISVNQLTPPEGILKCDQPFDPLTSPRLFQKHFPGMIVDEAAHRISPREYEIHITNTGAEWTVNSPIYFTAKSSESSNLDCAFTPQR